MATKKVKTEAPKTEVKETNKAVAAEAKTVKEETKAAKTEAKAVKEETKAVKTETKAVKEETKAPKAAKTETKASTEAPVKVEAAAKKAPAKKAAAKKDIVTTVYVEYMGRQVAVMDCVPEIKKIWRSAGNKVGDIKDISLYAKPEDNKVYFVVNGDFTGSVDL